METPNDLTALRARLADTNELLAAMGMPRIEAVSPKDCFPQDTNARFMTPETLDNLAKNIARDKRLESMPLCYPHPKRPGKFMTISGHHRIEACVKIRMEWILVMVITVENRDEIVRRQLSHNSVVGNDDEVVLSKLFASLSSLDDRFYAGLQDQIANINPVALNFKAGLFAEMAMVFMPEDIQLYDDLEERIRTEIKSSGAGPDVRVVDKACFEDFAKLLRSVKKLDNVKSNAAAFTRIVELASRQHAQDLIAAKEPAEHGSN